MTRMHNKNDSEPQPNVQEQLEALQGANQRSSGVQERARQHFAVFATVLALLIGLAHAIPIIFRPDESLGLFLTAMAVYVVAVLALTFWYLRIRSATPAGANKRYLYGLFGTFVLYGAAVFLWPEESPYMAVMIGLVIAIPLTLAAWVKRP